MKKEDFIKEMISKLNDTKIHDIEGMHWRADDVLCEALVRLGYKDIVDVYEKMSGGFFYA